MPDRDFDKAKTPPIAERIESSTTIHGRTLTDSYAWLRDRDDPRVLRYLEAENTFTEEVIGVTDPLRERLFGEMRSRIKETDVTVPARLGRFVYYTRTVEGLQYPIHCRRAADPTDAAEQVLLDLNEMAEGLDYLALGDFEVSDDGNILAFSTDTTGYRQYTLQFKELRTGEILPDRIELTQSIAWAADNRTIFYTTENHAKRPWRLWRHLLGSDADDPLVYEESDPLYWLWVYRSRSRSFVFAASASKTTTEARTIPADRPEEAPTLVLARKEDHEYDVDHHPRGFVFRTNHEAKNFRLVIAPESDPGSDNWREILGANDDVKVDDFLLFSNHCAVRELVDGLPRIRIIEMEAEDSRTIEFDEPAYSISFDENDEFDAERIRLRYESLSTPPSIWEVDMSTMDRVLLKRDEILGGYDPADYVTERLHAIASDGARVPISLVRRRDAPTDAPSPLVLYGYGSYGHAVPIVFSSNRLSLIDRGITWAIAHVRGGGELGTPWHDHGKLHEKTNTFTDFIRAAEHLVETGYTTHDRLAILGASAGGLLVGAVLNLRPDLCRAAVALVPFVDVLNTMLDPDLPLTIGEYLEWGNPNEPRAFADIASWCPYTNLEAKPYPDILVRSSLNDSQVGYWEGAKYVAKLRSLGKVDDSLLLRVNLEAGHGGSSGRYDHLREVALDWAFILSRLGAA